MSCNNVYLKDSPCAKSIGGIRRGWFTHFGNIAFALDYDDTENTSKYFKPKAISSLYLTPDSRFDEFITKPDKVTITENITIDESVGGDTTTTEIVIKQTDMLSEAVARFKQSTSAEFVFLFEDMQGRYFIYGIDKPVKLSSATVEGGNVIGDFNGGTFTFTTEGALSRFWTKYEAENGDYSSNYINIKQLLSGDYTLSKSSNLDWDISCDTGYDFGTVIINSFKKVVSIILNFDREGYPLGQQDTFSIPNTLGENISFYNDEMYDVISYYHKKGLNFEDKKEFTFIYKGDPTQELMLKFGDGMGQSQNLASLEFQSPNRVVVLKGYVTFKRSVEPGGNEDVFTINQLYWHF